jgi:succinoglycan biosynthesis transport protein ExoP
VNSFNVQRNLYQAQRKQGMELEGYFRTLWKWRWLILICTLCAGGISFAVSYMLPPVYEAQVLLMSNQSANTGIVDYSSWLGGEQVIETYRELLQTRPMLETVIARLSLPYSTRELARRIEVDTIPNTQLLRLRVEDSDAQRAADIANEIVLTFLLQRSAGQQLEEIEAYEQILVEQMTALKQAIEKAEAEIERSRASPGLLTQEELATLQARQSQQRAAYANLLSAYLSIRSTKSRLLDLLVAEPAQPPVEAIRPRKMLNTAVAAASGCMIACALAFLIEYLNDSLENANDVRDALSLRSLGSIPHVKAWQKNDRAHVSEGEWPIAEAFRILRTNIRFANVDSAVRTLLVTSAEPGEGKTSVVANLGTVMAQDGRKVLLVDADLRRSQLHRTFEVQNQEGLTSLILDDVDWRRCLVETDIPDLYVLPGGPVPPNPSELLGSQRMAQLIEEFQAFADVVLFDTPSALAFADAMVLASQVDGVLLVIDSRSTRRETAIRALERLRNVKAKVLGGVLNRVRARSSEYYYSSDGGKPKKTFQTRRRSRMGAVGKRIE